MADTKFEEIMNYCASNNSNVFHSLLSRCKSGYAVPYIGAGLSMFAGLPSWYGLLEKLKKQCSGQNFSLANPFDAADEIVKQLGLKAFCNCIRDEFHFSEGQEWWIRLLGDKIVSNEAISIIPKLFYGPIITSNYDKLTEAVHGFKIKVVLPDNIEELEKTSSELKHVIYKVHGCVSQPEEIVFTGESYKKYYDRNSNHVRILSKFFKRFNLLFLGCGLNLDIKDKPIELWETLVSSGQQHYAILPCAKQDMVIRRKKLEEINISPIFYPEGNHGCVRTILEELQKEKERESIKLPEYDSGKHPFIGRVKYLTQLETWFKGGNNGVLSLSGSGGIGKTRMACEYARLNKRHYTSGIYFFHAVSEEMIVADALRFLKSKMLIDESELSRSDIYEKLGAWMRGNDNWLIILDNVEERKHIERLMGLYSVLPASENKNILITTRNNKMPGHVVAIDIFSKEETEEFFYEFTREEPDDNANSIAELLGRLPLALEQSASYIAREKISYRDYYQLLEEKGLLKVLKEGNHSDETLAVNATYNLSIEKISKEETKQLLILCSYFAPENIKFDWLYRASKYIMHDSSLSGKNEELQRMVDELSEYSLIHDYEGKISVHRLTQNVVRNMIHDEKYLEICSTTMADVFDLKDFDNSNAKSVFLEGVPHMEQMFDICEKKNPKYHSESLGRLYHIYMFGFDKIKEHDIALRYKDRTLEIRRKMSDQKELAKTINLVGVVCQNKGDYDNAYTFFDEAMKLREQVCTTSNEREDESYLARTYNNIALNHYWKEEFEMSESFHKKALKIKEKYKDEDPNDVAFSYNNIGALYEAMSKRYNYLAMDYHQKAFDIRKGMENKVNKAFSLNNMGVVEKNLGNYLDAMQYFMLALKYRIDVYGQDAIHPEIAQTCTNIADIYINMGKYYEAKQMLDKAIEIYEQKLTNTHIDTSNAYYNLAKWYYAQSLFDEASFWFKQVLDIRSAKLCKESESEIKELQRMIERCKKKQEDKLNLSRNNKNDSEYNLVINGRNE